ncbi:hypothetical protein [Faecalimonas sp.]
MKKKIVVLLMACALAFNFSACSDNNDAGKSASSSKQELSAPLEFLGINTGDTKDDVLSKYPDATVLDNGNINCRNIDTDYGNENNLAFFMLNDSSIVYGLGANWRTETENKAREIYDSLKEKAEAEYGDSFEVTHDGDSFERCNWETDKYSVYIALETGDALNGNLVEIEYTSNE